jgi:hypothetical protein
LNELPRGVVTQVKTIQLEAAPWSSSAERREGGKSIRLAVKQATKDMPDLDLIVLEYVTNKTSQGSTQAHATALLD